MSLSLSPLIRFGTSTWTYEGWQGQVYKREYAKSSFTRECLGEYCQYQYEGEPLFRTVGNDATFYRPPTANQLRHYLTQIPEDFQMCFKVFYRGTTLGPRRGELLNVEWSDVDMQRREFTLRHTKNGENRTVPMPPEVYRVFTELWQERRLDTQRVFLYKGMPVRDVKTAFDKACKRAGVMNLRLHDLRHTASTNLRRAGVDATTAMKIVGHKSERMHRRYNTVEPEDLRRAVSQLAAYHANTVITPERLAAGTENVSACISNARP